MTVNQLHQVPATRPMKGCFQSFDRIAQSGAFLPCFAGCAPTAASTSSVSDSQCLYSNNSAVVRTARRRARRFDVEDLASFGVALRSLIGVTKNGTVAYEPGTQASAGIFLPPR